jgi:hypothetical protein
MDSLVKYIGVGFVEMQQILASFTSTKEFQNTVLAIQVEIEVENLLIVARKGEGIMKNPSFHGVWYTKIESEGLLYLILVNSDYSNSMALSLLTELHGIITKQKNQGINFLSTDFALIIGESLRKLFKKCNDREELEKIVEESDKNNENRPFVDGGTMSKSELQNSGLFGESTGGQDFNLLVIIVEERKLQLLRWKKRIFVFVIVGIILLAIAIGIPAGIAKF